jgi:hypothetical protein
MLVVQEVQAAQQFNQEEYKAARKGSFDMHALGAADGLDEQDADIKRLQEDAASDQLKLLEKWLAYWLPVMLIHPTGAEED